MNAVDISRVDLNLLVVFEALLAERHVGRAAARLNLSQSAISHALNRLRRLFNDPLFARHPGGIEPTPRARDLATLLAAALAQTRQLLSPAGQFEPAGLVRSYTIASHDYAIVVFLNELLFALRREAPHVNLRCVGMSYPELIAGFDRGAVDMACGAFPGFQKERIERTALFEDRMVGMVRANHPGLALGRLTLETFVSYPHVLTSPGWISHSPVDDALNALGVSRRIAMTVPNSLSVPSILAGSDLIGVMPQRLASIMAAQHQCVPFDLPITLRPITCDLLTPRALAKVPEIRWIVGLCQRVVRSQPSFATRLPKSAPGPRAQPSRPRRSTRPARKSNR